jgi:hypothetical protein
MSTYSTLKSRCSNSEQTEYQFIMSVFVRFFCRLKKAHESCTLYMIFHVYFEGSIK